MTVLSTRLAESVDFRDNLLEEHGLRNRSESTIWPTWQARCRRVAINSTLTLIRLFACSCACAERGADAEPKIVRIREMARCVARAVAVASL